MRPDDAWNDCEERAQAPVHDTTNCSFRPPRTSEMQAASHIPGLDNQPSSAVGATVSRGLRDSQSEPLLAMHISTFTPSTSSPTRSADGLVIGHGTEGNTAPHRGKDIHIPSGCCPNGAAQRKRSQACDRLLVHVALACPQLPAWEGNDVRCVC